MQRLAYFIAGLIFAITSTVYAATVYLPVQGGTGTSVKPTYGQVLVGTAGGVYIPTATSSLGITGGSGSAFPFTPSANYNATSTTIGFLNGLFSTASSTFSSTVFETALSQGLEYIGSLGQHNTVATSTPTIGSILTYSGTLGNLIGGVSGTFGIAASAVTNAMLVNKTIVVNGSTLTLGDAADTITAASSTLLTDFNTLTKLQSFNGGASSTGEITSVTSSSTNLFVSSILSALYLADASGKATAYGGATCTNQFVRSLNGAGAATCNTVSLTTDITGTLGVANGGTASTTLGALLSGNGTSVYSTATTTLVAGTNISFSGGTPVIIGSLPVTINAVTSAGASYPFTSATNYVSTTTTFGFFNGIFSTASSTFNSSVFFTNLAQGLGFVGTNGIISTVSTSTLSATSPLTGSFVQIGSGGTLGIQAATNLLNGYLGALDFSLIHAATTTFSSPLTYTQGTNAVTCPTCNVSNATVSSIASTNGLQGGTITTSGTLSLVSYLATSSAEANGNLAYWTTTAGTPAKLGTVATGTLSATAPLTVTSARYVIGGAAALAWDFTLGNTWTGLQQFNGGASSTGEITSVTSSSTNEIVSGVRSALHLGDANGVVSAYSGAACTNQFVRSLNGAGAATCNTVSLTTDITGTLGVANGGTASTTLGGLLSGNGTAVYSSATTTLIAGTNVTFSGGTPVIIGSSPVTINSSGGSSFAYLFPSDATTTKLNFNGGASSTGEITSVTSSSTNLFISGIPASLLKTVNGLVTAAVAGTDYLTGNQTITLSGDVSGSGATAITTAIGANKVTLGMHATQAANTVIGNATGVTGNVTAIATSSLFQTAAAGITGLLSGTDWTTFNNKGNGTVTSIVAGTGLSGGTISSTGNISLLSYLATSSGETAGQSAYWTTTNGTPAKLTSIATSTPTIGSVLSYTGTLGNLIGGTSGTFGIANNAVTNTMLAQAGANTVRGNTTGATANVTDIATSTFFGNPTPGFVLAFLGGQNTFVATTTFSSGLTYANGNVTNTGVTSIVAGTNISISGATGAVTINSTGGSSFAYLFPVNGNATTSPLGIYASTTIGNGTVTGGLTVSGTATTTNLINTSITSALYLADASSKATAYAGSTCTNQFVRSLNGSGVATCNTVSLTTDVTGILPVLNGGTNASSFTTTGNGVYWDGTRLVTAPTGSAVTYPYASTTMVSATTASSTNLNVSAIRSALHLGDANGLVGAYGGSVCTNQFVRSLNGAGTASCATVANTDLASSNITINSVSVSLGGSITVASTTLLADSNKYSSLQFFNGGASSTGEITAATASSTTLFVSSVLSALHLADASGKVTAYGGATCTNQFVRSLNGAGAATCNTVSLTLDVTGTLPVLNGGTGSTNIGAGQILASNASGNVIATSTPTALYFTATSTTLASLFPYASTTMISATTASTTNLTVSGTSTLSLSLLVGTTTQPSGSNYMQIISNVQGALGGLLINTWTNVANAFRIINAAGTTVFNVDTTSSNTWFGVGTSTPWTTNTNVQTTIANEPAGNGTFSTTTLMLGDTATSTSRSCIEMNSNNGTTYGLTIVGSTLTVTAGHCL